MQFPERPKTKSLDAAKSPVKALAVRINRAADDLNPLLMVLAVGLLILNITLYLGMSVAREPFVWSQPQQSASPYAPATPPAALNEGAFVSAPGN